MKLLFISTMGGAPWGGSEMLWADAAHRALARGDSVAVSVFDSSPLAPQVAELKAAGAQLILRARRPSRWSGLFSSPGFLREFEQFSPHAICLSQGAAFECVGRRATRPISTWLSRHTVRLVNLIQYNAPTTLKPSVRRAAAKLVERANVNAFVAQRNITQAAETLGHAIPRARVVRNPINLSSTDALPWPSSETLRLACVARLDCRTKGQAMLIDALAAPAWRTRDWSLSFFGTGADHAAITEAISRHQLGDRVHLRGHAPDLRAVWAEHHALVLPSRAEGTPLAMVEAMLLGRPSVVTDVGGCTEWVRDGVDGFVALAPDVSSLGTALERLWAARRDLAELGQFARQRAFSLADPDPAGSLLALLAGDPLS